MEIFGIPTQALFGQLLIGLINGSFYALLSLGLAVIFGLLNIINFTHGAQYMMGAFCAYFLLTKLGIGYWWRMPRAAAPARIGPPRPARGCGAGGPLPRSPAAPLPPRSSAAAHRTRAATRDPRRSKSH